MFLLHSRREKSTIIELLLLITLSFVFISFFYRGYIISRPLEISANSVPYLSQNIVNILSNEAPWYTLLTNLEYSFLPINFGLFNNVLEVYIIGLAPIFMYLFLKELRFNRISSFVSSLLYLINPISFPFLLTYPSLNWQTLYIFLPILALALVKYTKTREMKYVVFFYITLTAYIQIQVSPYLYNFRLIIPSIGILYIASVLSSVKGSKNKIKQSAIHLLILLIFSMVNIIPLFYYTNFASALPGSFNHNSFYAYHLKNVIYTYQSQNLFYSISGIIVYPKFSNFLLEGQGQEFFPITIIWVVLIIISVLLPALRKNMQKNFLYIFSTSAILSWAFLSLVQAGIFIPLFKFSNLLFLWEYPSYLEMPLAFVYIPLFANLFDFIQNKFLNSHKKVKMNYKFNLITKRYFLHKFKRISYFLLIFLLLSILLLPMAHFNAQGNNQPSKNQTLPLYFNELTTFFHGKQGGYKVMMVPFNRTISIKMTSALPVSNLLTLPASYENRPEYFANATYFNNIYSDIYTSNYSGLPLYLNLTFVKYIVLFHNALSNQFLENFASLKFMNIAESNSNFTILQYKFFNGILINKNLTFYRPESNNIHSYYYPKTELFRNTNFTNGTEFWGYHSSDISNSSFLNISSNTLKMNVYGNSSKYRQLSQIWQTVYTGPDAVLDIKINVTAQENSYSSLYFLFHDNLSRSYSRFTNQQLYLPLPKNETGSLSFNVTSPQNAEYAYVGLMTWNSSRGHGYISLSSITLLNMLPNTSSIYSPLSPSPYLTPLNVKKLGEIKGTYSVITPVTYNNLISMNDTSNITVDSNFHSIGFHNTSISLSRLLKNNSDTLILKFKVLSGSYLRIGQDTYQSKNSSYTTSIKLSMLNSSKDIGIVGFLLITGAWLNLLYYPNETHISYHVVNTQELSTIKLMGNGTVEFIIPSTDTYKLVGNITLIQENVSFSSYMIILKINGRASFLAESNSINYKMVIFNVSMVLIVLLTPAFLVIRGRQSRKQL